MKSGGRHITGEIRRRVYSRNIYKAPMDVDNRVGMDCGSEGLVVQGRAMGEIGTTVIE